MATETISAQGKLRKELTRLREVFEEAHRATVDACSAVKASSDTSLGADETQAADEKLKKAADEENVAKQALRMAEQLWSRTVDPFGRLELVERKRRPQTTRRLDAQRESGNMGGEGPARVVGAC